MRDLVLALDLDNAHLANQWFDADLRDLVGPRQRVNHIDDPPDAGSGSPLALPESR